MIACLKILLYVHESAMLNLASALINSYGVRSTAKVTQLHGEWVPAFPGEVADLLSKLISNRQVGHIKVYCELRADYSV